jgi:hypothetical protein
MEIQTPQDLLAHPLFLQVLHGAIAVWGTVDCFFGFRLFKAMLSLVGFFLGLVMGGVLAYEIDPQNTAVVIGGVVVGGLAGGILSYALWKVGCFLLGAWLAVILTSPLLSGMESAAVVIGLSALAGIAGGILGVILVKMMIIIGTSLTGAFRMVYGFGFFLGGPNVLHIYQSAEQIQIAFIPDEKYLLAMAGIGGLGVLIQLFTNREGKNN